MKALFTAALPLLLGCGAFAQGTIVFANSSTQLVMINNSVDPPFKAPPGSWVAFYYSPTPVSDPLSPELHLLRSSVGEIAPVAGRFLLGTLTTGSDAPPGSTIFASVRAWTGNFFDWNSAYVAAMSGAPGVFVAYSPVFSMGTGGDGIPQRPPVPLISVPQFTGLTLQPVAESAGPAIAGFGVHNNQFEFTISYSRPGETVVTVETRSDVAAGTWLPLQTLTLTNGTAYFSDPDWGTQPCRFYRIRSGQ